MRAPSDIPRPLQPVATVDRLTKSYDGTIAVEDISFSVGPGRVVGLLGRNGAGKTTIMKCLLGLAKPTSGECRLWGEVSHDRHDHRQVGVLLDSMAAHPATTARRELSAWAELYGLPITRVDDVLELVELGDVGRKRFKKYSTGMKRRLALAVALLPDPDLLILDEPTNGLDPEGIRWLREFLRSYAATGRSVLISSHQLAEIQRTVDEIVVVEQRLLWTGPISDIESDLEDRFFELVDTAKGASR